MKNDISSIELKHIVNEMQFLIGSRLDRIVQKEREVSIQFYATGKGNFTIRIVPGKYLYLTKQKASGGEQHNFVMRLRKRLPIATLKGINQIGSERIVELELENKEGRYRIYAELFGRGNVILCDDKGKVLAVLDRQLIEDQQKEGKELSYTPPRKGLNIFEIDEKDFEKLKDSSQSSLVKALAIDLNIGGVYSEELCLSTKISKSTVPGRLADKEISMLFKSFDELRKRTASPRIVYKGNEVFNAMPFEMELYKDLKSKDYGTFNEAIDGFLSSYKAEERLEEIKEIKNKNMIKTQKIIDEQGKALEEAKREVEENSKKGEMIYENYALVKEVLDELNKAKKRYSWAEIKEKLKGHKTIKSINEKDKKVVIEI